MKKISYILPTNRSINIDNKSLQSVLNLEKHDMEVIIASPSQCVAGFTEKNIKQFNIKFYDDKELSGACQAINNAYKMSDGDYICVMSDDIVYGNDFLLILDFMESDFIKKKEFKMTNIMWDGGPGLPCVGDPSILDDKNIWRPNSRDFPQLDLEKHMPFNILPMPFMSKQCIDDKFGGYIFHPNFKHHYGDNWHGYYISKNEKYEPYKWRCGVHWHLNKENSVCNRAHDKEDYLTFLFLVNSFSAGCTPYAWKI